MYVDLDTDQLFPRLGSFLHFSHCGLLMQKRPPAMRYAGCRPVSFWEHSKGENLAQFLCDAALAKEMSGSA